MQDISAKSIRPVCDILTGVASPSSYKYSRRMIKLATPLQPAPVVRVRRSGSEFPLAENPLTR
jgi:hypothetical protein